MAKITAYTFFCYLILKIIVFIDEGYWRVTTQTVEFCFSCSVEVSLHIGSLEYGILNGHGMHCIIPVIVYFFMTLFALFAACEGRILWDGRFGFRDVMKK
jgi:hypothetical protein